MATQFYFKREWLEVKFPMKESNWFACDLLESFGSPDKNGICTIPSEFIVHTMLENIIRKQLEPVLNHMGFRITQVKKIHGHFQSKIKILPLPYTDPRCRAKELQNKTF